MANAMPIAYVDSICKPHEKLLCMTFIWIPYGFAIGIIGNIIVKKSIAQMFRALLVQEILTCVSYLSY